MNFPRYPKTSLCFLVTIFLCLVASSEELCRKGTYETGVSYSEAAAIVDKHNQFRRLVAQGKLKNQPRGTNIKKMKWDSALAKEAQKIANTCEFKHRKVQDGRFPVGQNLYSTSSTRFTRGADWNQALQGWFDEYKIYRFPDKPTKKTGHYTQVAWADSEYVGCGYANYFSGSGYPYAKIYVCNYGPAGNIIGRAPYKKGDKGCENLC